MKNLIEKLKEIEQDISKEKGDFSLFALFLREDSEDIWDLLVSSPWIEENKTEALKYLARKIQNKLSPDEIIKISRIVIIEENSPALSAIHDAISVEHGLVEAKDSIFFGLPIKHAYLITSKKLGSSRESVHGLG